MTADNSWTIKLSLKTEIWHTYCQQSWRDGRNMDDDLPTCRDILVGENGGVRHVCQCAGALKLGEMYSVCSCAQPCQTTAFSLQLLIILLTADPSRGQEVNLSPILVNSSNIYVQIVTL